MGGWDLLRVGLVVATRQWSAEALELTPILSVTRIRVPSDSIQLKRVWPVFTCKPFVHCLLCVRHGAEYFACIVLLYLHPNHSLTVQHTRTLRRMVEETERFKVESPSLGMGLNG